MTNEREEPPSAALNQYAGFVLKPIPSSGETLPALARGVCIDIRHNFYVHLYKFINNLYYLNRIAFSTPPFNKIIHYKIYTL
jgi:hypothetical protein